MRRKLSLALVAALTAVPLGGAIAQVGESGYSLPLALAMKAATKAIETCKSNGYPVSAVIVDTSGVIKLEAKGDHSTILTTTSAFRKVGDEIVAALGVGGSPGGDKDEICAQAGVTSVKDDLPSPR